MLKEAGVSRKLIVGALVLFPFASGASFGRVGPGPADAAPSCQSVSMPDGSVARMCKAPDGRWVQDKPSSMADSGEAPLPQVADVTYKGTFFWSQSKAVGGGVMPRSVSLSGVLEGVFRQATKPEAMKTEGALTMKMRFDGASVVADISGTGGLVSARFTGLYRDGFCRLTDQRASIVYEGPCGSEGFTGRIYSTNNFGRGQTVSGSFSAQVASVVDITVQKANDEEKKRLDNAAAAEKQKRNDARRAQLKPLCDAGKLTACVEMDSLD